MKLYTRTGDDGTTGLFSGARVSKDHPRIEAYGTVDELNSSLGLAIAACDPGRAFESRLAEILGEIQSRLFDIGADLATPEGSANESRIVRIDDDHVAESERWIDEVDGGNLPMRHFVMPGGTELAARLHLARTICRRAERLVVSLSHVEPVGTASIRYLNRVSDLLFACARRANREAGVADLPWKPSAGGARGARPE
ncbi:MAG TPA: cob(I)yrinic acid a,c-diamide adenosyltransferase [Phycisphaerales bacterium]|nr:cob(I)yrinic acid a,c-diamide adenosyltransferase [Phycisphaerales bacterium]HMP36070.1 cob(I)yrinic acid a,c-diamide adenosyltransferase [Phycisphaerales bacterium]